MKRYCVDTSGFSTPLEQMPEDIHVTLWKNVAKLVESGCIAATTEIYDEMVHLRGNFGQCLKDCAALIRLEVGSGTWPWSDYLDHVKRMRAAHNQYISEYNGNRKSTIGLNDLSLIALDLSP